MGGKIFNIIAGGGLHVAVKVYRPLKEKVGAEFFKADKGLYACTILIHALALVVALPLSGQGLRQS